MFRRGDVVVMRNDHGNRRDNPTFVGMLGVVQAVERTDGSPTAGRCDVVPQGRDGGVLCVPAG